VVSGISVQNELIAYREGGMNTHPHKMIGQSDFGPVTFSKGLFAHESALYRWQTFLHSWSQGGQGGGSTPTSNDYRADITVVVYDHPVSSGSYATPGDVNSNPTPAGKPKLGYKLFNCWPGSYSLTDLNAGDSSIMIQQLVINYEGFHLEFAGDVNGQINEQALSSLH
jgi:phage tail-like protein